MARATDQLARSFRTLRQDPGLVCLAAVAYVCLIVARLVITVVPLRSITARLGRPGQETPHARLDDRALRYAFRVRVCVTRLARFTPTDSNCYPQALTAWWLLHRRGIPTTTYYGVAFNQDGSGLNGHVWLRAGHGLVTGDLPPGQRFRPLALFADT